MLRKVELLEASPRPLGNVLPIQMPGLLTPYSRMAQQQTPAVPRLWALAPAPF